MITDAHGNLLEADVEALVNAVNTVGVMGKGIALQFARAFPAMLSAYETAAQGRRGSAGEMHLWANDALSGPRFVINFRPRVTGGTGRGWPTSNPASPTSCG